MKGIAIKLVIILVAAALIFTAVFLLRENNEKAGVPDNSGNMTTLIPPEDVMDMVIHDDIAFAGGRDGVYRIVDKAGQYSVEYLKLNNKVSYVRALLLVDESLWIGFDGGLLVYDIKSGRETLMQKDEGILPDNRVNALYKDSSNRIWVGTWEGAACLDNGLWTYFTTEDGLLNNMVNVITEDTNGGIWFGSYSVRGGGVSCLTDNKWQHFTVDNGLANSNVTDIICDSKNNILVGTGFYDKGGLSIFKLHEGSWKIDKNMHKSDGLAGEKVRSLFEDENGVLYVGSEYSGLAVISDDTISIMTRDDGICHNEIKCIYQGNGTDIWLGTRHGITISSSLTTIPVQGIS